MTFPTFLITLFVWAVVGGWLYRYCEEKPQASDTPTDDQMTDAMKFYLGIENED